MIRFILMDVEGTTTSVRFVHDVLFPYAAEHLRKYVRAHATESSVREVIRAVQKAAGEEEQREITDEEAIGVLERWIQEDRKHTALKTLQGYLWKEGYAKGHFKGHIYEDVVPAWKQWTSSGIRLGIYSSGSVEAQKLLFAHSEKGDLTPFLESHFDTGVGHKRQPASYQKIREILSVPAETILFLSDVTDELDAAAQTGFRTLQIVRPGTMPGTDHPTTSSFAEISVNAMN